jgi:DNA-binding NarL/FixJ family response regulator
MNARPHLLIADDTLTAQCLQRLLEPEFPGVKFVSDGQALLDAAATSKPDLVLLDIKGPEFNGFDAMHRLREVSRATKVIVLTMHDEPEYVSEALHAGASGYVLKWCAVSELVTAIRAVLNGGSYLTPSLSRRVDSIVSSGKPRPSSKNLTLRQREVLQLVAQGRTAKEIANALDLSVKTAVFHKMAIMDKLGLRTTADLTRYALDHGILSAKGKAESLSPSGAIPLASDSASA